MTPKSALVCIDSPVLNYTFFVLSVFFNYTFFIGLREFVSCVQSIKILSSAEVEQMSLDGDLGHIPGVQNQACRL